MLATVLSALCKIKLQHNIENVPIGLHNVQSGNNLLLFNLHIIQLNRHSKQGRQTSNSTVSFLTFFIRTNFTPSQDTGSFKELKMSNSKDYKFKRPLCYIV